MNLLERIPTRWLLAGAALACLALWAAPSVAQTSGDPVQGKLLFEDTPGVSGKPTLGACTNCHTIKTRRVTIGGSEFADITYDRAIDRFGTAIAGNFGGAMGQFSQLETQERNDIAAYIADTPKVTATGLTDTNALAFVATAVGNAVTKTLTIQHSTATASNLQITSVSLASGTTAFTRTSACNGVTRAPAGTCTFSVTYTPTSSTAESKVLTVSLQQGSVAFTRTITLNGSVAGAVTPPPPSSDSGGGALGWVWLTGLALATIAVARRRG